MDKDTTRAAVARASFDLIYTIQHAAVRTGGESEGPCTWTDAPTSRSGTAPSRLPVQENGSLRVSRINGHSATLYYISIPINGPCTIICDRTAKRRMRALHATLALHPLEGRRKSNGST
ncbi:hypothetical protein EVAR_29010_1 [Eumeta japonica]|uniref:Uncharacterized protein n=1 Tax=Eumeta variegata TaxID=151549 RepID=A0A4C1W3Z3_EUMVA|nr:hypothetical protein EVAR_29010_1 [Eumeta japonica]